MTDADRRDQRYAEILSLLLDAYPEGAKIADLAKGRLPLHLALVSGAPHSVVQVTFYRMIFY